MDTNFQSDALAVVGQELDLSETRDLPKHRQALLGLLTPVRATKFLIRHRGLWPLAAVPATLSFIVFVVLATVAVTVSGPFLEMVWAKPDGLLVYAWWVVRAVTLVLFLVTTYFATLLLSAVVASPANDTLSKRIEEILGQAVEEPQGVRHQVNSASRGPLQATANLLILATIMAPILLLHLIPVAGSVAASILGSLVAGFFVALDFTDWTLERRTFGWRRKWRTIWRHRSLALGFGLGTSLLMWIPVVNLMAMPIAVIGGTSIALELSRRELSDA